MSSPSARRSAPTISVNCQTIGKMVSGVAPAENGAITEAISSEAVLVGPVLRKGDEPNKEATNDITTAQYSPLTGGTPAKTA